MGERFSKANSTTALWKRSSELAERKLLQHKLPPLWAREALSASAILRLTVWDLQAYIRPGAPHIHKSVQNILHSIEKYITVMDIAIQHTPPHLATLVWAGVKTIMQVCRF